MPSFSEASKAKLETCDYRLQKLFNEVIKTHDCTIIEGHRSYVRQQELFDSGKSKTMHSRHLGHPSGAVDVMAYPIDWEDKEKQKDFALFVYETAMRLGVIVRWGGAFKDFYDAPHWQVNGRYPEGEECVG